MTQQVQNSSDCCINSKFSCSQKGYFEDEFLQLFTKKLYPRSPIINRGYYIRFKAMEEILMSWCSLASDKKIQIISLGAGYDSSYFRLKKIEKLPPKCHFVEIDFLDVVKKKLLCLEKLLLLPHQNQPASNCAVVYHSPEYSLFGNDLKDIDSLRKNFQVIGIEAEAPTLFISECSITYMEPEDSKKCLSYIQKNFPNSTFVAYEQAYPDDAFGIIMRKHFTNVGCTLKSISTYPDEDSQRKRFIELGWSECSCITMYDFYESLPEEEKNRIQHLELFDEFEMWHEKCHHYILVHASQGSNRSLLPIALQKSIIPLQLSSLQIKSLCWKFSSVSDVVQRFGHQAVPVSPTVIMLSGGFGMSSKKHKKLGDIVLYDLKSTKHLNILAKGCLRMCHSAVKLSNNTVVLLGGRASPKDPLKDVVAVHFSSCSFNESTFTFRQTSILVPAWRHSASVVCVKGVECIFIFGGRTAEHTITNKCFLLNTKTWQSSEIAVDECAPSARHSHSSATYQNSSVIVSGGLSLNEYILQSLHCFDCQLSKWSTLHVPGLLPRYSHTSHIWQDHLFLVGGVTSVAYPKLGVGVINLITLQAYEVSQPGQDPEYPIMLYNHCSYLKDEEIFIVGGGGNCFSFGTHFNQKIVSFDLRSLF